MLQVLAPGSNEKQRAEANSWLMAYAATGDAWEGAHSLLIDPDEQVQYFGANLLFMKVRSEWHSQPDATKTAIYGAVRHVLAARAAVVSAEWTKLSPGLKRLSLVLAGAAVRSSAAEAFAREALAMVPDQASITGASTAVELLTALPQEILERSNTAAGGAAGGGPVGLSRAPSMDIQERPELRALVPPVLSLLVATVDRWGAGASPAAVDCTAHCLRCLTHWLSLQLGCSLLAVLDAAPSLLTAAMHALSSSSSVETVHTAAADCLVRRAAARRPAALPAALCLPPRADTHASHIPTLHRWSSSRRATRASRPAPSAPSPQRKRWPTSCSRHVAAHSLRGAVRRT